MSVLGFSRPDDWSTLASKLGRGLTAVGLTATVAAATDIVLAGTGFSPRAFVGSVGLGLAFGLTIGAVWALLAHLLARAPRFASWVVWPGLALWAFAELAWSLRAHANLGTRYNTLAVGTLVACGLAAMTTGGLLVLLQPSRTGPPQLMRAPGWIRSVVGLGLVAGAFAFAYLDRSQFPGQYATFHFALQGLTLFCIAVVVLLSGIVLSPRRRMARKLGVAAVAVLVLLPFPLLHAPFQPALETMMSRPFSALPLRAMRLVTDVDGDGSSALLGGGDCAPFDAEVSPRQREIVGNGVDDDCSGSDANSVAAAHQSQVPVPVGPSPQHVVLITVDTVRPDLMSAYGYERNTTPELARWFADGTKFTRAYAAGGWTSIAIPAILLGVNPRRLQWTRMYETNRYRCLKAPLGDQLRKGETPRAMFLLPLSDPHWSLATYLRRRGMFTAAVVDGGFTEILSKKWGTAEGFDVFVEINLLARNLRNDAQTADQAIEVLRNRPRSKPFFLWVHFFGPHARSTRHPGIPLAGDTERDLYEGEITYADQQVGRLLRVVDEQTDRPVTVLMASDHGERVYNARSRGHGRDHLEENIRVPLLAKGPGFPAGEVDAVAGAIDLMPTVLDITETPGPPGLDGISLRAIAAAADQYRDRILLVDTFIFDKNAGDTGTKFRLDLVSAVSDPYKLTMNRLDKTLGLYDVDDPAGADRNLLDTRNANSLQAALRKYFDETGGAPWLVD